MASSASFSSMHLLDGFSLEDIRDLMDDNPNLRGFLHGYLAELALLRKIQNFPGVDEVSKIPDVEKRKGDLEVKYLGTSITIECKSLGMSTVKRDELHDSWQGSVSIKNSDRRVMVINGQEETLVNLDKGHFDILAVNCFAVEGKWDFLFIENQYLMESDDRPGFITSSLTVHPHFTPCMTSDLQSLLHKVFLQKIALAS